MNPDRRDFAFVIFLGLIVLLGGLAAGGIAHWHGQSREAAKRLAERVAELHELSRISPPPTEAVGADVAAKLQSARRVIEKLEAELTGRSVAARELREAKLPVARTEAYYDLGRFREEARELARGNGVGVGPEAAHFGFSAFVSAGPDAGRIEAVLRQRRVVWLLLEALVESHPKMILSIQREPELTAEERAAEARTAADPGWGGLPEREGGRALAVGSADTFVPDRRLSVRVPGVIGVTGFRIAFSGETSTLRNFLNRLAELEVPLVVRDVAVEPVPASEGAADRSGPTGFGPSPQRRDSGMVVLRDDSTEAGWERNEASPQSLPAGPLVARPVSRFTLTIEYLELLVPAGRKDRESGPTATGA